LFLRHFRDRQRSAPVRVPKVRPYRPGHPFAARTPRSPCSGCRRLRQPMHQALRVKAPPQPLPVKSAAAGGRALGTSGSHRLTIHSSRSRFAARLNSGVMRCCNLHCRSSFFGRSAAIFNGRLRSPFPTLVSSVRSPLRLSYWCHAVLRSPALGRLYAPRVPGNAPGSCGW
jgi:hypothetical protein